ncbi:MAG: type II secretion system protein GspN [Myxococcota bacterium]
MKQNKTLRILGYVAFAWFSLLVGLYLTFPAEAVAQRLSHEITKASGGRYNATFAQVSPDGFSGIEAENVKLLISSGGETLEILVDRVYAHLRLLPLLAFNLSFDVEIQLGEGSIEAVIDPDRGRLARLNVEIDTVDFSSPPILTKLAGLPLGGILNGDVALDWSTDPKKASGHIDLKLDKGSVGPAQIQGFSIPATQLGKMELRFELAGGKLQIVELAQAGGDISLRGQGSVLLRPPLSSSTLDLCLEAKPQEEFLKNNPTFRTALDLAAQLQVRRDAEGFLHIPVRGNIDALGSRSIQRRLCNTKTRASKQG